MNAIHALSQLSYGPVIFNDPNGALRPHDCVGSFMRGGE